MSALFDHVAMLARIPLDIQKVMDLPAQIDPPFPAVTVPTEQEAPNHNGAVAVPYVNSIFKDDE